VVEGSPYLYPPEAQADLLRLLKLAYRAITYEDVEQAMKRSQTRRRGLRHLVRHRGRVDRQFYEDHYRKWVDEPLPALGGRTPRAAARLGRRAQAHRFAQEHGEHVRAPTRESQPTYNFGWMWGSWAGAAG